MTYENLIYVDVKGEARANVTDPAGERIESEISRYMATYPTSCPDRQRAVRIMRDALAELIADDVADGATPNAETVQRYGIISAMARANLAAFIAREQS